MLAMTLTSCLGLTTAKLHNADPLHRFHMLPSFKSSLHRNHTPYFFVLDNFSKKKKENSEKVLLYKHPFVVILDFVVVVRFRSTAFTSATSITVTDHEYPFQQGKYVQSPHHAYHTDIVLAEISHTPGMNVQGNRVKEEERQAFARGRLGEEKKKKQ